MTSPFFSIIVPTYNRAHHIRQTIASVLNQRFENFELIVVDDGSTDDTELIVEKIKDPRLKYFRKENGERAAARNFGILRSSGSYVTFLDSDDKLYPEFFEIAKDFIARNKQPQFFHSGYEIKDEKGKVLSRIRGSDRGNLNDRLATGNFLSCIGVFVRQDIIKEHLFNENRELAGSEDYELWVRLASRYPLLGTGKITAYMVQHSGRSVLNFDEEKLERRINLAFESLQQDKVVCSFYKGKMDKIRAHLDMYVALHLLLKNNRERAVMYLKSAVKRDVSVLFSRKMLSLLYKMLRFGN